MKLTLRWLCVLCASAVAQAPDFLLPDDVLPRKHIIEMTIDPARDTYGGWARIEVDVRRPQKVLWVNGKDLTVQEASVQFGGKTLPAKAAAVGGEFISLEPPTPVGPGKAVLSIRYQAPLSEKAVSGPFRKQVEGEWYAFTTFTPIDARRAFPCFDEPRFKTPWEMAIRVRREHKAFANAPAVREVEEANGMKLVQFSPTRPLPAEVVAFAVGPFDVWDGGKAGRNGVPVRVITAKGHAAEGKEAALATREVLPRLEAYTGIPYPWEKLDHIALPEGAFGATENAGLITYRAAGLLVSAGSENPERLRRMRGLQAHEIGHQWFGNLVTQAGWEDVWLSEGFATWFSAKIMDQEQPPERRRVSAVAARERIMLADGAADAGERAQPVRRVRKTREEMRGVYNQFAYQKGAGLLLMLENWLGEDRFQEGLQRYLKAHQLSSATTADVAAALRSATGTDPAPVMSAYLDRMGFPSVRAEVRCDGGAPPRMVLEVTQPWTVPVCWRAEGAKTSCTVVQDKPAEIALAACPSWIFPNAAGAGYYRSEWTPAQLNALAISELTAAERLTLAYDLRAQEKAGRLDASVTKAILTRLTTDAQPEIVRAAKEALGQPVAPEAGRPR